MTFLRYAYYFYLKRAVIHLLRQCANCKRIMKDRNQEKIDIRTFPPTCAT